MYTGIHKCLFVSYILQAYAEGIHYPNYAWITLGYLDNHWWMEYEKYFQEINCTQPTMVMNTVLNRSLVLLPYPDKQVYMLICKGVYVYYTANFTVW